MIPKNSLMSQFLKTYKFFGMLQLSICFEAFFLTLLVFEFVVSPTHDYTTFSDYGSDVCINYLLFAFLFLLTSHRFVQRYSDHAQRKLCM